MLRPAAVSIDGSRKGGPFKAVCILVMALLAGGNIAAAQTADVPMADTGTPSQLGTIATAVPVGGSAVPLGATSLYVGGLSPSTTDPTNASCADAPPSVPTSNVDPLSSSSPCAVGFSAVPGSGAVTSAGMTSLGGTAIPLGATDLGLAGISPILPVAVPTASATPVAITPVTPPPTSAVPPSTPLPTRPLACSGGIAAPAPSVLSNPTGAALASAAGC
jgi:hypothetical protein